MRTLVLSSLLVATAALAQPEDPRGVPALQAAISPRKGLITACYDEARKKAPDLAGRFLYSFTIGTDGKVKRVVAQAPTPASERLDRCVTKVLSGTVFQPGAEVTISYPFMFQGPPEAAAPAEKKADEVDPTLVKMFNDAAEKGKAGKHQQALDGYRAVLALQQKKKLAAIPRFLSTVHLQASYALIDLGKLADAEKELKLVGVDELGKPGQYDYYWTLGNVLGGQGKLKPMFSALVQAISIAEDLDDLTLRPPQCWTKILAFTMKAKDWAYLEEVSQKALQVAKVRGYTELETKATVALSEARKNLKK